MQNQAMLTWIIPVYNGEKYLAQAIDSILRQPCGDFQIIVVDDGSTDRSLEIAKSYTDSRITVLHKENGGVSSARNMGIDHAESRYIAFLDADDVMCKDAYNQTVYDLMESGKYDLLDFSYYYAEQNMKYGQRRTVPETGELVADLSKMDPYKHFCSRVFRTALFCGEEKLRFPEGTKVGEDTVTQFLAVHLAERIYGMNQCWFVYRRNQQSVLHNTKIHERMIQHTIPAWNWCKERLGDDKFAIDICDAWLFAQFAQYIVIGCRSGVPVKEIKEAVQLPYIQTAIQNKEALWASQKRIYDEFSQTPTRFWLKQRIKAIPQILLNGLSKWKLIQYLYVKLKFTDSLENIV